MSTERDGFLAVELRDWSDTLARAASGALGSTATVATALCVNAARALCGHADAIEILDRDGDGVTMDDLPALGAALLGGGTSQFADEFVRVPAGLLAAFQRIAAIEERDLSDYMRTVLEQHVGRYERALRTSLDAEMGVG